MPDPRRVCPACGSDLAEVPWTPGGWYGSGLACPQHGPCDRWGVVSDRGELLAAGSVEHVVVPEGFDVEDPPLPRRLALPVARTRPTRVLPAGAAADLAGLRTSPMLRPFRDRLDFGRRASRG